MTKKFYEDLVNGFINNEIGNWTKLFFALDTVNSELVKLNAEREERERLENFKGLSFSVKTETSTYNANKGQFRCSGYSLSPAFSKREKTGYRSFNPNVVIVRCPNYNKTFSLARTIDENGEEVGQSLTPDCVKDTKNTKEENARIEGFNKVALTYFKAKNVHNLKVDNALRKIAVAFLSRLDSHYQVKTENDSKASAVIEALKNGTSYIDALKSEEVKAPIATVVKSEAKAV